MRKVKNHACCVIEPGNNKKTQNVALPCAGFADATTTTTTTSNQLPVKMQCSA